MENQIKTNTKTNSIKGIKAKGNANPKANSSSNIMDDNSNNLEFNINEPVTGEQLLRSKIKLIPYLIQGLFLRSGLVALAGGSDTGKSTFLRQLAIAIVLGLRTFLGFKVRAKHNNVIYVSTEDDPSALAVLLKKQVKRIAPHRLTNLRFLFDAENLITRLKKMLKEQPADCIIIDAFTDVFPGDINSNTEVRSFLKEYRDLAMKHNCLIIFLHHIGKGKENFGPSKNSLLGSQGFEAKMRVVVELRLDKNNADKRQLYIVKGNYIPAADKQNGFELYFDSSLNFNLIGKKVSPQKVLKNLNIYQDIEKTKKLSLEYHKQGLSARDIEKKLESDHGIRKGKSTIAKWIRLVQLSNTL